VTLDEIKKMTSEDLYKTLNDLYEMLFQARQKKACGGQLDNPSIIGFYRNRIAQVKTVLRAKMQ
jgi:ribosomal protein L29